MRFASDTYHGLVDLSFERFAPTDPDWVIESDADYREAVHITRERHIDRIAEYLGYITDAAERGLSDDDMFLWAHQQFFGQDSPVLGNSFAWELALVTGRIEEEAALSVVEGDDLEALEELGLRFYERPAA